MVGADPLQRQGQRGDRPAQLDDFALHQVDVLDVGFGLRREDVLLHRVDVGLDEIGDVEVASRPRGRRSRACTAYGPSLQLAGALSIFLRTPGQAAVVAVAHGDHEVASDEDHDLAGLDDLAGQGHRFVLDVVHGLEHQEQRVVVALEFGPLVGVHRVFDREFVQPEHVGDGLHLVFVGFVKAYPHERGDAVLLEFAGPWPGRRGGCTCRATCCRRHRRHSRPSPARRARESSARPGGPPGGWRASTSTAAGRETMACVTSPQAGGVAPSGASKQPLKWYAQSLAEHGHGSASRVANPAG